MDATELYRAGRLDEAIAALGLALRDDPTNAARRTFLFELLCFAGEYDRAEKQLDILARNSRDAELGAWLFRSALHAERLRQTMFLDGALPPGGPVAAPAGALNGVPFASLSDADPRIGARLEVFAAGQYTWLPFEHITSLRAGPPRYLRDLLWIPARVQTRADYRGSELGEVLIPALTPLCWREDDAELRLGRATDWREGADGPLPVGQKVLLVDGEPLPLLELRTLEFTAPSEDVEVSATPVPAT
jgi:type VI secretion system protein ImpE